MPAPEGARRPPVTVGPAAAGTEASGAGLLALQRLAGNRAVGVALQRCGAHVHSGCRCAELPVDEQGPARQPLQRDRGRAVVQRDSTDARFSLPIGSVYAAIPGPALRLLERSFRDRVEGRPGAGENLDNAFWGAPAPTLADALDRLGTAGIELLAEIHARSSAGAFSKIQYAQNFWSGSSRGFRFTTTERANLETDLRDDRRFCRDTPTGESEHRPSRCYREVVAGAHGIHYCLHESAGCGVHIDMHQTVAGKLDTGVCDYSWRSLPLHWNDVFLFGPSLSPFELVDLDRARVDAVRDEIGALPASDPRKEALQRDHAALAARMERLAHDARRLAVRGEPGEIEAETSIRPEAVLVAGEVARLRGIIAPPRPPMQPRAG